jgi:hypothetical protein
MTRLLLKCVFIVSAVNSVLYIVAVFLFSRLSIGRVYRYDLEENYETNEFHNICIPIAVEPKHPEQF